MKIPMMEHRQSELITSSYVFILESENPVMMPEILSKHQT